MSMNQPSRVAFCTAGAAWGSCSVQVCQVLARWLFSVPWYQVGVGSSFTHG
jgi:hypothetical protein